MKVQLIDGPPMREPRWYRKLPEAARNLPPDAYDHCAAKAEVMTPDATLRDIYCGKKRERHGRWHQNRKGVVWRGKWKRPTYMNEYVEAQVADFRGDLNDGLVAPKRVSEKRGGYTGGPKEVADLKPPPPVPGAGVRIGQADGLERGRE